MGIQEHRTHRRFPFIEDVLVDGSRRCTSSDISEGGIYISAIQQFEEGVVTDLTIPFKAERLTLSGQVMHSQPGIGVGIMFVDLNEDQRKKIRELVASLANKTA